MPFVNKHKRSRGSLRSRSVSTKLKFEDLSTEMKKVWLRKEIIKALKQEDDERLAWLGDLAQQHGLLEADQFEE